MMTEEDFPPPREHCLTIFVERNLWEALLASGLKPKRPLAKPEPLPDGISKLRQLPESAILQPLPVGAIVVP